MNRTEVFRCENNCKNSWQDAKYGSGKRVMNSNTRGFSCTVCGKEKGFTSTKKK